MKFETKFCSSLAKILPGKEPETEIRRGTALRGERYSFQLAYKVTDTWRGNLKVEVESAFGKALRVRKVGLVPVEYSGVSFDEDIISPEPGLYPDVLSDLDSENAPALPSWRSLWITVDIPARCRPGSIRSSSPCWAAGRTVRATDFPSSEPEPFPWKCSMRFFPHKN